MIMTKDFLYNFIRMHAFGVFSTVSPDHKSESAVVGIVVTPDLKIFFDTLSDSRKYQNILANPNISFVIGWDHEQTIQYEGIAGIPGEEELDELLSIYFESFPDGVERKQMWKNIAYICVKPKWIRYSDFREATARIEELVF
jgi:general stress protein 26